jgi:hypothetical protein
MAGVSFAVDKKLSLQRRKINPLSNDKEEFNSARSTSSNDSEQDNWKVDENLLDFNEKMIDDDDDKAIVKEIKNALRSAAIAQYISIAAFILLFASLIPDFCTDHQ